MIHCIHIYFYIFYSWGNSLILFSFYFGGIKLLEDFFKGREIEVAGEKNRDKRKERRKGYDREKENEGGGDNHPILHGYP